MHNVKNPKIHFQNVLDLLRGVIYMPLYFISKTFKYFEVTFSNSVFFLFQHLHSIAKCLSLSHNPEIVFHICSNLLVSFFVKVVSINILI